MKAIWFCLVVLLAVLVIWPPNWTPRATSQSMLPAMPRFQPNATAVAVGASPGAIVCTDVPSIQTVFHLYSASLEDREQDAIMGQSARAVRGPSIPAPAPEAFGCTLLPAGTPVEVYDGKMRIVCAYGNGQTQEPVGNRCIVGNLAFQLTDTKIDPVGGLNYVMGKGPDGRWANSITFSNMLNAR